VVPYPVVEEGINLELGRILFFLKGVLILFQVVIQKFSTFLIERISVEALVNVSPSFKPSSKVLNFLVHHIFVLGYSYDLYDLLVVLIVGLLQAFLHTHLQDHVHIL